MSHRVVIADDAAFMREMLSEILSEADCEVVAQAGDGAEAVAAYLEHRPDVITLDIVMPCKNGIEALREIRAQDPDACVVMCSALGQETLVTEAMEAGASEYVVKPFQPDQVLGVLERVAAKRNRG